MPGNSSIKRKRGLRSWRIPFRQRPNSAASIGAEGGARTRTEFPPRDFKSRVSAIPPLRHLFYFITLRQPSSSKSRSIVVGVCRRTIHLGQSKKKRRRDRVSCAKVELPHRNLAKGDHISHEQEYNTGHGISAISHEVRRKIRCQPRQSEIQQEPVVHLLPEAALGWKCGIPGLSVQAASQPSKPAYGSRTEAHPGHAPQKSIPGHD